MKSSFEGRLVKEEWEVRAIDIDIARALVAEYHYAGGASNTAVYLHGLFRSNSFWDSECMGVAWWMPPIKAAAVATHPENWQGVFALSRLVILPDAPKNAATFLLSRSRKMIDPKRWPVLVTYADEWRGHTGGIYKADNWEYAGMTRPTPTYLLNGRMTSRKATKTRTHAEMVELGCVLVGHFAKHKYVFYRRREWTN